jgi:hypothetical protein
MMQAGLNGFYALLILYLTYAFVVGVLLGISVFKDMRGKWPSLTRLQWLAALCIFAYNAIKHGLKWPYMMWRHFPRRKKFDFLLTPPPDLKGWLFSL